MKVFSCSMKCILSICNILFNNKGVVQGFDVNFPFIICIFIHLLVCCAFIGQSEQRHQGRPCFPQCVGSRQQSGDGAGDGTAAWNNSLRRGRSVYPNVCFKKFKLFGRCNRWGRYQHPIDKQSPYGFRWHQPSHGVHKCQDSLYSTCEVVH